jgi:zinc transporter 1/2/3
VAVAAHKGLAAYALGAAVVDAGAGSGRRFWSTVGAFAAATPVGIAAGAVLADAATGGAAAAVSALAAGTFVYVAAMEVLPRELSRGGGGGGGVGGHKGGGGGSGTAAKLGALCAGFGLMTLLAVWT